VRDAAKAWGVSKSTAARWIASGRDGGTNPLDSEATFAAESLATV
jgi:transposase